MATALGITLGTRYLRAASPDGPCVRHTSVITLDGAAQSMRTPESGTSTENPRVGAGGMTLGGFVERVGDPVPLTAADGATHLAEDLTVAAIKSLARAAAAGFTTPPSIVVGIPAWWAPHQLAALKGALAESSLADARLEPDLACALAELRRLPDFPADGLVAVVDAGASGTTVGIIDGGRLVADPLHVDEPSGNDIDHALMRHILSQVVDDPSTLASPDPNLTAALGVLRVRCAQAKEELSATTAVDVDVDLPTYRGDVRITRDELDDVLEPSLDRCASTIREALERAGRSVSELTGIAAIGGGASIGALTQHLSGQFHLPVLVDADPATTAVRGAARRAAHLAGARTDPAGSTGPAARRSDPTVGAPARPLPSSPAPAEPPASSREFPVTAAAFAAPTSPTSPQPAVGPRPVLSFAETEPAEQQPGGTTRRRRMLIIAGVAAALALLVGGTAAALSRDDEPAPPSTPASVAPVSTASSTTTSVQQAPVIEEQPEVVAPPPTVETTITSTTEPWPSEPPSTPEVSEPDTGTGGTGNGTGGTGDGSGGTDDGSGGTDSGGGAGGTGNGGTDSGDGGAGDGSGLSNSGPNPAAAQAITSTRAAG